MTRARTIANFGDGIATADIGDGQVTAGKLNSTLDLSGKTVTLPAGVGGKVLQVVSAQYSTEESTTSGSYGSTSLSATITPSSTSNKIFIMISTPVVGETGSANNILGYGAIYNGTTQITEAIIARVDGYVGDSGASCSLTYLDSPNTTSAITYTLQIALGTSGSGRTLKVHYAATKSTITLMEIAG